MFGQINIYSSEFSTIVGVLFFAHFSKFLIQINLYSVQKRILQVVQGA